MSGLSLHEALYSGGVRRLRPDPIPEEDLRYIVDAATQAPSARNQQSWAFVVVTDPGQRARLGEIYREVGERVIRDGALARGGLEPAEEKVYRSALRLAEHLSEAPALVLACMHGRPPRDPVANSSWWGSIYPAVQNLMLAARSRGLGTTLTTLHKVEEERVKAVLDIPAEVETVALIPVGYPRGSFQRPLRAPSEEVTHRDRWRDKR